MVVLDRGEKHVIEACGMAYVRIYGAAGFPRKFINWMAKQGMGFKPSMGSGWTLPCHLYNQSFERKRAWCDGYAAVLRSAGEISATTEEWVN
jgi:hypothetical protein